MSKFFYKGKIMKKPEHSSSSFETAANVRLGTDKAPAVISVQTEARKEELISIFVENGWASKIDVNPDQEENIRDLEILQQRTNNEQAVSKKEASRNDPCPCGSGKKYKKCCAA
ncbi:MAG: SWIM/SEC-C metal-binding protein [Psychrobacter glaciei]|jgi:SWIM/SEC-C metal-binding protein